MKLMIDENIVLDVLLNREPYVEYSSYIWKLCETKQVEGYVSALTFANIIYIIRKIYSPVTIEFLYKNLSLIFNFVELSPIDLSRASEMKWNDFEDAMQAIQAQRLKCDYIITRNVKDFKESHIQPLTPKDYLLRY